MKTKKIGFMRRLYISFMRVLMWLAMGITCAVTLLIIVYAFAKGLPSISWKLISTKPSYIEESVGILPDILNTLYIVMLTLIMAVPVGVGAAIYLNEYADNKGLVSVIEYTAETLSGIPSVIYGLVGMLFFCRFLSMKTSLLAGSLTLVIINLPTIMRTTQESLKTIPSGYREGAFALGAGKWYTIRTVILPCCIDGIITGCVLAIGRIVGESAALLFTAGFAHSINGAFESLRSAGATLSVALYVYAKEQGEFEVAFAIAAILLFILIIINLVIIAIRNIYKRNV